MKCAKCDAKRLLRDLLEKRLVQRSYVSVVAVRHDLAKAGGKLQPATVNRYLAEFHKAGVIYDAGRGWYSSLKVPLSLDPRPVEALSALLQKQFPFLKFSCWSTDQVKPFMQHLLVRTVSFVSAEGHALKSVHDCLEGSAFNVYVDPKKSEALRHVQIKGKTIILRPSQAKEPPNQRYARIEEILVDLRAEVDCLSLMDVSEYQQMANEIVRQGRVQMASLLSYAYARRITLADLFGNAESIISTDLKNVELVD